MPVGADTGVTTKSTPTDVVTASDHAVETLIRGRLAELRPGEAVVGEEQRGPGAGGPRDVVWVVDPIDGTVNFLYGLPWYAVSLAAVPDGATVAGAVVEPASGRLLERGRWAPAPPVTGSRLRVSTATELALSMLATGFSYSAERRARQVADGQRHAPATGAGPAPGRVGRAGPLRGRRRLGGRLPRARLQLVGLGRRGAHRHRGRRRGPGARPDRDGTPPRRRAWARTPCWPRTPGIAAR